MKSIFRFAACAAAFASVFACNQLEEGPQMSAEPQSPKAPVTKAYGDKTPKVTIYVETNDVNPLNAGDYMMEGEIPFADIVELFAANIHKDANGDPTLYLNDKLTNVLENGGVDTYVKPLQNKGIKVLLTTLGDWQRIGHANMTDSQADKFAAILAYAVEKYGLDGIGMDDEYSGTSQVNYTSYTRIITKLREHFDALEAKLGKELLITVFDWGGTYTIDEAQACPAINHAYHGYFGSYMSTPGLCTKEKWSPMSVNLGQGISTSSAETYARNAKNGGYGSLMFFNLRTANDMDPLDIFQAVSDGAFGGLEVYCEDGNQPRTAGSVPGGFEIKYSDIQ